MKNWKQRQFKSGYYRPHNVEKFEGVSRCVYRSSWELKFLKWVDYNDKVKKVYYERVVLPYICKTDNKLHKYYVDCKITMEEKTGLKDYLIEIKPFRQTIPPTQSKRKKKSTIITEKINWLKNNSKWESAKKYCEKMGYRWCVMTEKGIYIDEKFHEGSIF